MPPRYGAQRASLLLIAAGVVLLIGLTGPSLAAAPGAQAQSRESPTPRFTATPRPTQTADEERAELEQRKLTREIRLLDGQIDRMRQQEDIDSQAWRAPAAAVASFGPTLVGLGLLYLLARAISRWRPAEPLAAEPLDDEDDGNLLG
jgi:hypothetical protein